MSVLHSAVISALCARYDIPEPESEYVFASPRRWRFDFAWPEDSHKVALEVDGGIWQNGRHTRGLGYLRDIEKLNRAAVLGWRVIRCTPQTLITGVETVAECLKQGGK